MINVSPRERLCAGARDSFNFAPLRTRESEEGGRRRYARRARKPFVRPHFASQPAHRKSLNIRALVKILSAGRKPGFHDLFISPRDALLHFSSQPFVRLFPVSVFLHFTPVTSNKHTSSFSDRSHLRGLRASSVTSYTHPHGDRVHLGFIEKCIHNIYNIFYPKNCILRVCLKMYFICM